MFKDWNGSTILLFDRNEVTPNINFYVMTSGNVPTGRPFRLSNVLNAEIITPEPILMKTNFEIFCNSVHDTEARIHRLQPLHKYVGSWTFATTLRKTRHRCRCHYFFRHSHSVTCIIIFLLLYSILQWSNLVGFSLLAFSPQILIFMVPTLSTSSYITNIILVWKWQVALACYAT